MNHAGTKFAFNDQVVDFELNTLGKYTLPDGWYGNRTAFSRSGARLYHYAFTASAGRPRVYVYDNSQTLTSTVNFPVLGFIDVAELPHCPFVSNGGY